MAPRRSHKKSRAGCQRCKSRRIKCDEIHPSCGNCVKHAIICDFSLSPEEQRAVSQELQSAPRVAAVGQVISASSAASPPLPRPSPVPVAQQSNIPTLGLIVSGSMHSPAPSQVHHQHSPGVHDHGLALEGPGAHSASPITPSSTIGHSSCSIGNTTDPLLLHDVNSKESPNQALPSPSPSSLPSSSFAISANQLALPSFNSGIPTAHQTALNMLDLSLMHQWSIATAFTTSNRPAIQQLWRIDVPALAIYHPFLMHALLAVSAMHLYCIDADPTKRNCYLSTASRHHERAVRGIAACLTNISRENCDALFVTSCMVVIFSFLAPRINEPSLGYGHSPGHIAPWIPLLRGVKSILQQGHDWVMTGPLSPLLKQYKVSQTEDPDPETERVLQSLYRLCTDRSLPGSSELSDTGVSTAYFSAIAELTQSFTTISKWDSILGDIFSWPISLADRFVELLVECRPRALVIFMHYCSLFTLFEDLWWVNGSALFEMRKCEPYLSEEWAPWIEWPRQRILAGDAGIPGGMQPGRGVSPVKAAQGQTPPSIMTPPPPL